MDPYKVLGIERNATDDEVKKAYRDLVKKYHPDKYASSDLKDLASEKLKEINAAYDEIQRMRQNKGSASYERSGSYSSGYSSGGSARYQPIRARINAGDLAGADSLLDAMSDRDAEWNFLKGVISMRRGWYDGARQYFTRAHSMDPSNQEYAQAYASVNGMGNGFGSFYGNNGTSVGGCDMCDICTGMMCANLCCGSRCC